MKSSYTGNRYTDGEDDLALEDVEDFSSEYYETQPGDVISSSTTMRRTRKWNNWSVVLLTVAALSVIIIAASVMFGGKKGATSQLQNGNLSPSRSPTVDPPVTLGPTHDTIESFIATLVGPTVLSDPTSLASKALKLLEDTHVDDLFGNARLQQRFALACLWLNTFGAGWKNKQGWFSASDECAWYGIECKNHRLIALNLTDNGLVGVVPMEIKFLKPTLLSLEFSNNELINEGEELAWMGELTNLRVLDIEQTSFAFDGIPPYLSKLKELKVLDISDTLFIGELDGSIFAPMQNLMYLEMGGNIYNSTMPSEIAALPSLEAFYIYDTGLYGDIEFLPKMRKIVELWLDQNPDLEGTIPTAIGNLGELASFSVTNCDLWGQIPTQFGQLSALEQVWFYGNWFSGSIPTEFVALPKLQILGLEDNNITKGVMPVGFCKKEMAALSADCDDADTMVVCECCTCCTAPCPAVNLPSYDSNRLLQIHDDIRKL